MKKRIFAVLLTLCMVIPLLPTVALAVEPTRVYIWGVELTSENPYYYNGTSGAVGTAISTATGYNAFYDAANSKLYLNDLNIVDCTALWEDASSNNRCSAIRVTGDITLDLTGYSNVSAKPVGGAIGEAIGLSQGVFVDGDLTVTGSGSLTASAALTRTASGRVVDGIFAMGDITVSSGSLTGATNYGTGIDASYGVAAGTGDITVDGGSLVGMGCYGAESYGVAAESGDITVSSGSLTGYGGAVHVSKSFGVYAAADSSIIEVRGGSLTGKGGSLSGNATTSQGVAADDIKLTGGKTMTYGESAGFSQQPDLTGFSGYCWLTDSMTFTPSSEVPYTLDKGNTSVTIISEAGWLDTDADGKYLYADFSWISDATNDGSTAEKAYLIADAADLAGLAAAVSAYNRLEVSQATVSSGIDQNTSSAVASTFAGKYFRLTNDIDLQGKLWSPIGTGAYGSAFAGIFDGNAKTVDNLTIDTVSAVTGLFGRNSGLIDSLTVGVDSITASSPYTTVSVGGLAGDNLGGTIRNCSVILAGDIIGKGGYGTSAAGGLVGMNRLNEDSGSRSIIQNCFVTGSGTVTAGLADITDGSLPTYAGGLVGSNDRSIIENCYCVEGISVTAVKGKSYNFAGALLGITNIDSSTVEYCYYSNGADVTPDTEYGVRVSGWTGTEPNDGAGIATCLSDSEMLSDGFPERLNSYVTFSGNTSLKQWIKTDSYPAFFANDPPVLSDFTVTQPSASSPSGSIVPRNGTAELYEYSTDGGTTWTTLTSDSLATAGANAYLIRYKATQSDPLTITINAYTPPSTDNDYTPATYTVPVESGAGSVNASATVSNGTANVSVNNSKLDDLLADSNTTGSVSIDAGLNKNINTATIPTTVIDKIADAANDSGKEVTDLEVALDSGTVSLDAKALAAASEQATGSTISIHVEKIAKTGLTATQKEAITGEHADDLIVEVTIKSGNTVISNYDGGLITVTLPYELKEGEVASGVRVWHLASDGSLTLMKCSYDETTKTVSFVTDHLSDFIVGYDATNPNTGVDNPFTDVAQTDWFFEDVMNVYYMELMKGTSDTTFAPHGTTTRGMIVEILYRLEKSPAVTGACPFDDVTSGKYYENAVTWAAANKIVDGYGNARFSPEDPITREQMAAILYRYEQYKGGGFTGAWMFRLDFPDADKVSDYAYEAMCWCTMNGIVNGNSDGTLAPQGNAERCQVAAILNRFIDSTKK